ncbi:MAG: 23S rRNA (uracil(1939)-C(5))-methyltransferase RlmD [Gammaproteobacteria bacterium]|nr:23S rRNA (uracil(1939)-C(5))-methyltransferase RlmD [Gammaproteobacteria bacterium]
MRVAYPSEAEQTPICQHFGVCGGCRAQHLRYETQLGIKSDAVAALFADKIAADGTEYRKVLGAPAQFEYRNKVEFTFSNKAYLTKAQIESGEQFDGGALGFHAPRFFAKAVDVETCHLCLPSVNRVRNHLKALALAQSKGLSFYNTRSHEGIMRNFTVRSNRAGELIIILVLGEDLPELALELAKALADEESAIVGAYWVFNPKKNSSVQDLEHRHLFGAAALSETLGTATFELQPAAFFQTNPAQAEALYALVFDALKRASQSPVEVLYDLYCGAGSIGLYCRSHAKRIVGVDYVETAIVDARRNAMLNDVADATYIAADMGAAMTEDFFSTHGAPEVIIVDPARPGMSEAVCQRIDESSAHTVIYVSCNAESQLRDLGWLPSFRLQSLQTVDMFPQTPHTETVAILTRK